MNLSSSPRLNFIAIEGPIGAGKTSLSQIISQYYNYVLIKEIVEENPFLSKFYGNIEEWAFQTEMFFLCNRIKQLEDIRTKYLGNQISIVSDYHIFKNILFAQRTLSQEKFLKYRQIYDILVHDLPLPNIIVYIKASLETLMSRISMRGREFEKNIHPQYLLQLSQDYEVYISEFRTRHPEIPVIEINGDEVDYVNNEKDREQILAIIDKEINKGEVLHDIR
jgi:deoxyguanosine kinase